MSGWRREGSYHYLSRPQHAVFDSVNPSGCAVNGLYNSPSGLRASRATLVCCFSPEAQVLLSSAADRQNSTGLALGGQSLPLRHPSPPLFHAPEHAHFPLASHPKSCQKQPKIERCVADFISP